MKLDICHVLSDTTVGGAGIFLRNLVSSTDPDFFAHRVLLPRESKLSELLREAGATVIQGDFAGDRSLSPSLFLATARLALGHPPDLLHTHGAAAAAVAGRLLGGAGLPIMSTLHCAVAPRGPRSPFEPVRRFWAATSEEAACILRHRGVPSERLRVITNGSPRLSPPTAAEREAARAALGVPGWAFTVGISARLEPIKDHDTLLRAVARLVRRGENILAIMIGDGSLSGALSARAASLGISDRVIFTGYLREVRSAYCALDVHVNCSLGSETSPLAVSETMSMGIPQAVSDCAGNLELTGGGRAALVFPRRDCRALSDCLSAYMHSRSLCERYSAAARDEHAARLSVERMARKYEKYYLDVCT